MGIWMVSAVLIVATAFRVHPGAHTVGASAVVPSSVPSTAVAPSREEITKAVDEVVNGNIFQREQESGPPEQVVKQLQPEPPRPPAPPKPPLQLRGVIGGPPWDAVLEGVPGRQAGVVVRLGDHVGGLGIVALKRDTVVVEGFDTTWTLTMRRP
jgi:hypothetical protein